MFQIFKKHPCGNTDINPKDEHAQNGQLFFGSGPMLLTAQVLLEQTTGSQWYATVHIFMYDIFGDQHRHPRLVARADSLPVTENNVTPLSLTLESGTEFAFTTKYYPDPADKQHYDENCIGFWFQSDGSSDKQLINIENTDVSPTWLVGVRHIILTDPPLVDSSKTRMTSILTGAADVAVN